MTVKTFQRLALSASLLGFATSATSQDWPQWRGPNRDGAIVSFDEPEVWPAVLQQQWAANVGVGYATPVLVDERIYMFTRVGDEETMRALDARNGEILWSTNYPAPFELNPYMKSHGMGPKATPTYADGRLFTFEL
jgi:outer membrane protein assembly factor BamB